MSLSALLVLSASLLVSADPGSSRDDKPSERKPNPWAPTLPLLSQEEEKQLDEIIDRFILFDSGKLTGDEGKKAKEDFEKLGSEATFALIRGLNRAAKLEGSCPALIIAKKLNKIFAASDDKELLDFAKENVGAGVKESRHANTLADLKLMCQVRKSTLVRNKVPDPPPYGSTTTTSVTPLTKMNLVDLASAATTAKPAQAKQAVLEIANRTGDDALSTLASIATTVSDPDVKQAAREALDKGLGHLKSEALAEKMKDKLAEMRAAAARVGGTTAFRLGNELIGLLEDASAEVRDAAHDSLVRLAGGKTDFGPSSKSDGPARSEAVKKWRDWWASQKN
jgi:hypothetical protein